MAKKIKLIQCGVGTLGAEIVRLLSEKRDLKVVAAVDVRDEVVGKDLGEVAGLTQKTGIKVSNKAAEVFKKVNADVVVITTLSNFEEIFDITKEALQAGKNVITSCEEACFPWTKHSDMANKIDKLAKSKGVSFLGTGINPGFMLDFMPITLTALMEKVDKINIRRVVDMAAFGPAFYNAFGLGKGVENFNKELHEGKIGGFNAFQQIMEMIAKALDWGKIDYSEEKVGMVSESRREAKAGIVEPGTVHGVKQIAHGFRQGKEVMNFEVNFVVSPDLVEDGMDAGNFTTMEGKPAIVLACTGEQARQGNLVSAAHIVNSIPALIAAKPGIRLVYELPATPCLP